ncbi:hypothetical protein [Jhaorihella thermophila]|uniref:Uncharacterized protein n=1 Tax=Jhaorihella thermophila TaxID=488547 RepID=A0A1H5SMI1_9RHOB|nr:hypothetical protein [Jhaorihella thermophila]SEF51654.1 hypothetical protein SAMN05421751_101619 [Jhaorihella thermophila]
MISISILPLKDTEEALKALERAWSYYDASEPERVAPRPPEQQEPREPEAA